MKITDVRATAIGVPSTLTNPDTKGIWGRVAQVFVEVGTDAGMTGLGEAFAYGVPKAVASVVNETLAPMLIGKDPSDIAGLTYNLFQGTHLFGRYGITTFAISGVEIALWDLAGKRAGLPLCELLGGSSRHSVPAYSSLIGHPEGDAVIRDECRASLDAGYTMIKLHQRAPESVAAAREVVGPDVPITVDINCVWSPEEAADMASALNEYDILWLEEPVWPPEDFAGLASVQEASGVALASGENLCTVRQFDGLMDAGAVTYVQPSVTKVGGIGEWRRVAELAELRGFEIAPHSPYFGPGFVATLHLIAATRRVRWVEDIFVTLSAPLFTRPLAFGDGAYTLPNGPGLGIELHPELLDTYRL